MNKMWCRNNLDKVGKWVGKASSLFGVIITFFIVIEIFSLNTYAVDTIPASSSKPVDFKLDLKSISKINELTLPINDLINEAVKGLRLNEGVNMGTGIPVSPIKSPSRDIDIGKFFSRSIISSDDVTSFLKEAAVTGIKLSILIVSITTDIVKGILNALKE